MKINILIESIEEVMNLLGGPTMSYAPEIENKERGERIHTAHMMLLKIWKKLKAISERS